MKYFEKKTILKLFFFCFAVITSLLATIGEAYAGGEVGNFNFNETTGLINIPVAKVMPQGSLEIALQAQDIGQGKPGTNPGEAFNFDDSLIKNDGDWRFIYGIAKNVEISMMLLHGGIHRQIYGAKWLVVPGGHKKISFAVGVQSINMINENLTGESYVPMHFIKPSYFAVGSYTIPIDNKGVALDLHCGIGTNRLRRFFYGGEFHFSPRVSVLGEYDGTIRSAGMKYVINKRLNLKGCIQFQQPVRYGFSLNYLFNFRNTPEKELKSENTGNKSSKDKSPAEENNQTEAKESDK